MPFCDADDLGNLLLTVRALTNDLDARSEPDLRPTSIAFDMNMWWFAAVARSKEEDVSVIAKQRRHPSSYRFGLDRRVVHRSRYAAISVEWSESADNLLVALARMVPETLRDLAGAAARDEAQTVAQDRGGNEVEVDDVMRGWIRTTPPEQRNGLIVVIESLGLDPERYAEDLENAEGWDDEEDEGDEGDQVDEEPPDSGM